MAIASAQLRGQDANDKDALVHALQSMGVQRYDSMGLDLLIVELCHLFNEATGKTPTQWRDWRTNEERSNAGPFIHAVTESAGIAITPSRIRAAVESWRRVQILLSVPV
ncbi:MAG: hypothetical protein D6775_03780 [Caldilineae bacterium]|nr:MAG: hypothetical protein D6775_03780 [Caldilineae bacterium]